MCVCVCDGRDASKLIFKDTRTHLNLNKLGLKKLKLIVKAFQMILLTHKNEGCGAVLCVSQAQF